MTTTRPRGKASTPARPGVVTKQVLMGERPLVTGEFVSEAAITDLHNAYKQFIYDQNQLRARTSKLKGMVYMSFAKLFKFAQLLGLVELVREEPMLYPPPGGNLYSVRKRYADTKVFAVISRRRVFKLTDKGKEDERSWSDLCRAWREEWPAPQRLEVPVVLERVPEEIPVEEVPEVPVEIAPPKVRRIRRTKAEVEAERAREALVPTLKLQIKPTKEQYVLLLDHLHKLNAIGIDNKGIQKEVDKLADMVGEWAAETIESLQTAQDLGIPAKVIEYRHLRNMLGELGEALLDRDIPRAIESLEKLI